MERVDAAGTPPAQGGQIVILVVDDNAETNEALTTVLGFQGSRPVAAYDGYDALSQLFSVQRPVDLRAIGLGGLQGETPVTVVLRTSTPTAVFGAGFDAATANGLGAFSARTPWSLPRARTRTSSRRHRSRSPRGPRRADPRS